MLIKPTTELLELTAEELHYALGYDDYATASADEQAEAKELAASLLGKLLNNQKCHQELLQLLTNSGNEKWLSG